MHLPTRLSQPRLVQLLADWTGGEAEPPRQDVAERLAQWLGVPDAIALHAAHASVRAVQPRAAAGARAPQALEDEFRRVRATLEAGITGATSGSERPRARSTRGTPEPVAPPEAPGFGPWQQRYQEQQRRMDMSVDALRAHVRQALAAATPRLAQLAALDAVLDPLFGERTQRLLGTVPAHLERRFEQLRPAPAPAGTDAAPDDGHWRPLFEQAFQAALLAELDLRLQPVMGLLEALSHDVKTPP